MRCPYCQSDNIMVLDTNDTRGEVRRRRKCKDCGQRFSTIERPLLSTPLIIKKDGTREEFDREKLMRGIRIACAKRARASGSDRSPGGGDRNHLAAHGTL